MKDLDPQMGARGLPGSLVRPAQGGCRRALDGRTRRQTPWKWEGRAPSLLSGGPSCHELPRVSPSPRAAVVACENGRDGPLWTAVPRSVPQLRPTLCDPTDRSPPGSSSDHGDLPHKGTVSSSLAAGRYSGVKPVALSSWQVRKSLRLAGCCGMLPAIHHPAAPLSPQLEELRPRGPRASFRQVSSEPPVQTEGARGSVTSGWPPAGHRLDGRKDGDRPRGSPGPRGTSPRRSDLQGGRVCGSDSTAGPECHSPSPPSHPRGVAETEEAIPGDQPVPTWPQHPHQTRQPSGTTKVRAGPQLVSAPHPLCSHSSGRGAGRTSLLPTLPEAHLGLS